MILPNPILAVLGDIAGIKLPEDTPGNPTVDDECTEHLFVSLGTIRMVRQYLKSRLCLGVR